jgi:lipoprotein-anchoring transpeptidase ErfK/SrfK
VAALVAAGTTAIALCGVPAPAGAAGAAVPESRPQIRLLHDQVARVRPSTNARQLETVRARRPLTNVRTVLPAHGDDVTGADGRSWVRVGLPGRPSGHTGWIRTAGTRRTSTPWALSVSLSQRRVTVWHHGRVDRRFRAIVGKPSTPSPRGRFFVEEAVALSSSQSGGPYALATSARSSVLQEFDGGPGQIALHGTGNLSGALGTAVSHGCIRLSPRAITWLARRIGAGVPVTVTR